MLLLDDSLMMFDAFAFILLQCSRCSRAKAVPVQGSRSWGDDEALAAEAASTGWSCRRAVSSWWKVLRYDTRHHLKLLNRSKLPNFKSHAEANFERSVNGWEWIHYQTVKHYEAFHAWRTWLCSSRALVWHAASALTVRLSVVVAQSPLDHDVDPSNAVQSHSKSSA